MSEPSTKMSGTVAMMSALALRKSAKETEHAGRMLADEFPSAASNCAVLAEWYTNVADALDRLDADGVSIVRAS